MQSKILRIHFICPINNKYWRLSWNMNQRFSNISYEINIDSSSYTNKKNSKQSLIRIIFSSLFYMIRIDFKADLQINYSNTNYSPKSARERNMTVSCKNPGKYCPLWFSFELYIALNIICIQIFYKHKTL